MSRTPYSPFVEKETAPLPWKVGRLVGCVSERSSIPSEFVGIVRRAGETRQRGRQPGESLLIPDRDVTATSDD
jgi:hypothetical protein